METTGAFTLMVRVEFRRPDNEWETSEALIDTGASVCCISTYHPALINREIHPSITNVQYMLSHG